jgi:hypothetical protein
MELKKYVVTRFADLWHLLLDVAMSKVYVNSNVSIVEDIAGSKLTGPRQ